MHSLFVLQRTIAAVIRTALAKSESRVRNFVCTLHFCLYLADIQMVMWCRQTWFVHTLSARYTFDCTIYTVMHVQYAMYLQRLAP